MAKSRLSRKPAASAVAGFTPLALTPGEKQITRPAVAGFTPLALTPGEKQITRPAQTALIATVRHINGVALTLKTLPARADYFSSLAAWANRNVEAEIYGIAPTKARSGRGAAAYAARPRG